MANTLSINTFTANTVISSAQVNLNNTNIVENSPIWSTVTITSANLAVAALSSTQTGFNIDPKEMVLGTMIRTSTKFDGGGVTNVNCSVGEASALSKFGGPVEVATTTGFETNSFVDLGSYSATQTVYVTFSATGANLDQLTQGTVEVSILKNLTR